MDIYVKGFFYSNLGDDLFLKIITDRYPRTKFICYVNKSYLEFIKLNKIFNIRLKYSNVVEKIYNTFYRKIYKHRKYKR